MPKTLAELADFLTRAGMACKVEGDPARVVTGVATLEDAQGTDITFLANRKYEKLLASTKAAAVLVALEQAIPEGLTVQRVKDPYAAIAMVMEYLYGFRKQRFTGISAHAHVDSTAKIGENAAIAHGVTVEQDVVIGRNVVLYPGSYVGPGCRIGDDCVLYPNVVIYDGCVLGNRVTIHAGSVIGQDGLGYAPVNEKWHKIPQVGVVEIGDDVEIGANCAIDRATLGRTVIGEGTKFSDLIAIGHGTKIGPHCMFVAQVGLAGSVTVGRHVTMAGKVGVAGHLSIGDNAQVGAMAGVMRDVPADTRVLGAPAMEMSEMKRVLNVFTKLPELRDRVRTLENEVAELRKRLEESGGKTGGSAAPANPA